MSPAAGGEAAGAAAVAGVVETPGRVQASSLLAEVGPGSTVGTTTKRKLHSLAGVLTAEVGEVVRGGLPMMTIAPPAPSAPPATEGIKGAVSRSGRQRAV
mmetsp:Transcript_15910/g.47866  ORF Transcript_15910/g.47866 Transcript_15910/m.47866 type:complete len:100 (+) Transcript_15910:655-954(+)